MLLKEFDPYSGPLSGRNLIEASAGTGKTFTISRIFLRLMLEKGLNVDEILVVTFTEAATNELKLRILDTLNQALSAFLGREIDEDSLRTYIASQKNASMAIQRLQAAIQSFDRAAVFTIHSFCKRVMQENAFESGSMFDTELVTEQTSLLREVVQDYWRTHFYQASPLFLQFALSKTSPAELMKMLGNSRLVRLHLRILPEKAEVSSSAAEAALQSSYEHARKLWFDARGEIVKLLENSSLHKSKYKREKIPFWAEEMDACFDTKLAGAVLNKNFEKFTSAKIADAETKAGPPPTHPFFDACELHFDNHTKLMACYNGQLLQLKSGLFDYARSELQRRKEARNVFYFDDVLLSLHAALETQGDVFARSIRKKFKAALIDEFQDTDPVQYEIFNGIFSHEESALFLIGDPKQAIYGFRGADIFAYMQAKADTRPDSRYTLTTNYRSAPGLISAFNALFGNVDRAFLYEDIPFQSAVAAERKSPAELRSTGELSEPLRLWYLDPAEHKVDAKPMNRADVDAAIVEATASEIVRLLNLAKAGKVHLGERPLKEEDIAVLVRRNSEAVKVQAALTARNVNSVVYGSGSLFHSQEAQNLQHILAAIVEPENRGLLKTALATETLGVSAAELFAFEQDDAGLEVYRLRFARYHRLWQNVGFMRMFKELSTQENLLPRLMMFQGGERCVTNFLHLSEVLSTAAVESRLGMTALLNWLISQRTSEDKPGDEFQLRLESDEKAIKLITVHKSKGQEFPIVFCPFMWTGANLQMNELPEFHDEVDGSLILDLGSEDLARSKTLAKKEKLAENLRLFYVAATRAQHRCYFVWGPLNWSGRPQAASSALAYLLHHPSPFDEHQPVEALEKACKSLPAEGYKNTAKQLADASAGAIGLQSMPENSPQKMILAKHGKEALSYRQFNNFVDGSTRISSYSSLISRQPHAAELADHDVATVLPRASREHRLQPSDDVFSHFRWFPRGTRTGLFAHDLLEHLDFTALAAPESSTAVRHMLQKYGFDSAWSNAVTDMLKQVLQVRLSTPAAAPFSLSEIKQKQRLNELEFYFPLKSITPDTFAEVFGKHATGRLPAGLPEKIETLSFAPLKGYMKGFIDLVFEHRGRYYLLDWKSNFLGSKIEDYAAAGLTEAMVGHQYVLQYHIYAVALNQYLKSRVSGYDYNSHFGGALYIFLRGVELEKGSEFGVFFARPEAGLIAELTAKMLCPA